MMRYQQQPSSQPMPPQMSSPGGAMMPSYIAGPGDMPSPATPAEGRDRRSRADKELGLKPPKAPEKPLVPYMRYSRQVWNSVRAQNTDRQLWDIGRIIGQMWRELPEGEKSKFQAEYDREKVVYDREMKIYHGSREYQDYLMAKNAAKNQKAGGMPSQAMQAPVQHMQQQYHASQYAAGRAPPPPVPEGSVVIQPVDDDHDGDSQLNIRRLSQQRYSRNQRLVAELFSESTVADLRSVVTQSRMDMLRKQAESLQRHQARLEQELTSLESRFADKKQKIEEASSAFAEQLKEVCETKNVFSEEKYASMVQKAGETLMESYERYKNADKKTSDDANTPKTTEAADTSAAAAADKADAAGTPATPSAEAPTPKAAASEEEQDAQPPAKKQAVEQDEAN